MDNLCTSCLCAGRKLYFLSETGFEQLYTQILNEIPVYNISEMCIRICWECKALLRKLANFKEQVKTCYMELMQYLQRNTVKQFANFSRLQNHQNEILSFPQVTVKEDIEEYSFVDDDRSYVDDDILCMNNDDPDLNDEETHFEPATFVNDLNMDNLKKRKSGRKRNKLTKQKSKNKLNIIKQKGAKRNVKLKNVTQDELSNYTVESLIDSTAQDCYKRQEGRSEENKRDEIATDNIQLGSQANDRSASKQFSTFSHLNNNENLSYPQVSVKEEVQELPFADDGIPYVDDNRPFVDDDICMNNDDLDLKNEETHCEPETFVKDLNMDEIKKRKNGRKGDKLTKQKSKLKVNKLKSKKQKVKLKKISSDISQDLCQDELSNKTVESLIDSTLVDCYKKNEKRIGVEEKIEETEDSLRLEKESNDGVERNITRNRKLSNAVSKMMNEPVNDKPVCVECGKTFSSRKTYRYHLNVLHKGQNRYPCPRCGKVYQWKSNLGRHMRSHKARDSGELYCETCDKRFASVATFRQHLRISRRHVPESEFSFMCNECGKKFVNKTRLRDHIDWEHLKKIKFKCQLCNKPFKCHTSLYVHMQNVHRSKDKKDNLCHVCGKSYQNAAKLKYHIVAMHTTETPYQCQQCNAAFGWYSSLYRHVREVHYKLKVQPKKSKKQKKSEVLPSLLPVLPPIHHPV